MPADRLSALLVWTALAAAAAGIGAVLLARRALASVVVLGWANALAAALMLGVGYLLMAAGLDFAPLAGAAGALLGAGVMYLAHTAPGGRLPGERPSAPPRQEARARVLSSAAHSAPEGVAIGVAAALDERLGLFLALTLAAHNVSEGALLGWSLGSNGVGRAAAGALAVLAKSTQVVLAAGAFLLATAVPATLPWGLGGAFGALFYLSMADLLPESYRTAGRTSIALVVTVAAGVVGLLGGGAR